MRTQPGNGRLSRAAGCSCGRLQDTDEIIREHLQHGHIVAHLCIRAGGLHKPGKTLACSGTMATIPMRSMPAYTLERLTVPGAAGAIEVDINDPGSGRRGIALVAHPHPLQGGTKDNKVVTTLAKSFFSLDHVVWRPNFRGVGASVGVHDEGRGETDDLVALIGRARERYGELPLTLAGFSFGGFVQARVARQIDPDRLVLVAPAVNRLATERVPDDTLVIHGERDDVVPLAAVLDWARPQNLPIVVVPGGEHFFHGRLTLLARIVLAYCR